MGNMLAIKSTKSFPFRSNKKLREEVNRNIYDCERFLKTNSSCSPFSKIIIKKNKNVNLFLSKKFEHLVPNEMKIILLCYQFMGRIFSNVQCINFDLFYIFFNQIGYHFITPNWFSKFTLEPCKKICIFYYGECYTYTLCFY